MVGHLGFSYVGLINLLMLFIPNHIWSRNRPSDYDSSNESKLLLWFERVGQVGVTCSALIFRDFNPVRFSGWSLWLLASLLLMLLYEIYWLRYFRNEPTERNFLNFGTNGMEKIMAVSFRRGLSRPRK